jgi:hypothetical protein
MTLSCTDANGPAGTNSPGASTSSVAGECGGDWSKPGSSCEFLLAGPSLTISTSAYSMSTGAGDAEVRVSVEVEGDHLEWGCAGETTTDVPGDASPRPGETWAGCDWDSDVPASLIGKVARCVVSGSPGGDFSCSSY